MSKIIVDEDKYIEICNQELQKHSDYQEGMRIIGVPENASGSDLTGYNWEGPDTIMPDLVSGVVRNVEENYQLKVTHKK